MEAIHVALGTLGETGEDTLGEAEEVTHVALGTLGATGEDTLGEAEEVIGAVCPVVLELGR